MIWIEKKMQNTTPPPPHNKAVLIIIKRLLFFHLGKKLKRLFNESNQYSFMYSVFLQDIPVSYAKVIMNILNLPHAMENY